MFFSHAKWILPVIAALSIASAQVQLFEQDASGLVVSVGSQWSPGIAEYMADLEYNIEGRTTLGFKAMKPFADTLFQNYSDAQLDKDLKAYLLGTYLILEFVEPGLVNMFSFAMRFDFSYEGAQKEETNFNSFTRMILGGGPIFGFRFILNDYVNLLPTLGYTFSYAKYHRDLIPKPTVQIKNPFVEGYVLWQDAYGAFATQIQFDELNSMLVEPKLTLKYGDLRDPANDLFQLGLRVGYVRKF